MSASVSMTHNYTHPSDETLKAQSNPANTAAKENKEAITQQVQPSQDGMVQDNQFMNTQVKHRSFLDSFSVNNKEPLYKQNYSASMYGKTKQFYRSPISYSATGHLVRLSAAASSSAVKGIIVNVNKAIAAVKVSDGSQEEKQGAIRKMKRVIKRAQMKLVSIKGEERLEQQEMLAKAMEHERQANRLAVQKIKKRRARKAMDQCAVVDSEDVGRNPAHEAGKAAYAQDLRFTGLPGMTSSLETLKAAVPLQAAVPSVESTESMTGSVSADSAPIVISVALNISI